MEGDSPDTLLELHKLVGEDCLDFSYLLPGEMIAVGDHSALANLPAFLVEIPAALAAGNYPPVHKLYGRGVVLGHTKAGKTRATRFTVDTLWPLITWYD